MEQLPNVTQFFAAHLPVVAEPVIEVPKILPDRVPQRIVERRPPQMAEQLVEVADGASVRSYGSRLEGPFEARAFWPSLMTGVQQRLGPGF